MDGISVLAGLTLLVIGDSHVAFPGSMQLSLHDALTAEGATVHTYGGCAMRPDAYFSTDEQLRTVRCGFGERHGDASGRTEGSEVVAPHIADLLDRHQPDMILVVMGDNLTAYGGTMRPEVIYGQASALTAALPGDAPCFWAGPTWGADGPDYAKPDGDVIALAGHLADAVGPCSYLDGLDLLTPEEADVADGIHLSVEGYANWAAAIVTAMEVEALSAMAPASGQD